MIKEKKKKRYYIEKSKIWVELIKNFDNKK